MIQRSPMQLRLRLIALTWLSSPLCCVRQFIVRTQGNSMVRARKLRTAGHEFVKYPNLVATPMLRGSFSKLLAVV